MRIVLLGAPGSGKGTQANLMKAKFGVPHISTGDLLRAAVAAGTPLGLQAKAVMEQGHLVSDEIVLGMLKERLKQSDSSNGFILDGFPRTLRQVEMLDELLSELNTPLEAAVYLYVPSELLFERLAGRAKAEGRADDTPETVRNRLDVYEKQTSPLVECYAGKGLLRQIDGVGSLDAVQTRLFAALGH
jgi:adenylate kinase